MLALSGCGRENETSPEQVEELRVPAVAAPSTPGPVPSTVEQQILTILVDGQEVSRLDAAALTDRSPLAEVVPQTASDPANWRLLEARASDGRFLRIPEPSRTYAAHGVLLYVTVEGWLSIGLFRGIASPTSAESGNSWRSDAEISLVRCVSIDVHLEEQSSSGEVEAPALTIVVDDLPPRVVRIEELRQLTPGGTLADGEPGAGAGRRRTRSGWPLGAVIGLVTDLAGVVSLTARTADGAAVELTTEQVIGDSASLRQNRRGLLVLQPDAGGEPSFERLRGVVRLEILTRE